MTDTALVTPPSQLHLPDWFLDLDPASDEFRFYVDNLPDKEREALAMWLAALTPNATFEALEYVPTVRQWELHDLPAWSAGGPWDVLYGGAAGGGKSRGLLMDALAWASRFAGIELWLVRATYPQLADSFLKELEKVNQAKALGADYHQGRHTLTLPNGSTLKFRHAATMAHAAEMLSADCQGLYFDERTTMIPAVLEKLTIRVRSATPDQPIIGIRSASNPGDVGHMDVKTKFVDPAPLGHRRIRQATKNGRRMDRYFIPAKIGDNPHLDDGYEDRLSLLPPDLERAYREGDWSIFEGMAFSEFRSAVHVVDPEDYPLSEMHGYPRGVGVDYGVANPFCALWGARLPDGLIVVYRELYQTDLTPTEQARAILTVEADWERPQGHVTVMRSWLDPSCWARQPDSPKPVAGAPPDKSIAADYRKAGVRVERAYNDRIGGKRLIHAGLRVQADQRPRLVIYSTCVNLIRTLPNLPRDKTNPEDVDTKAEDHCLVAGTMIATPTGEQPLEALRPGDRVITATGVGVVLQAGLTGHRPVYNVSVGHRWLTGTANHLVATSTRGWVNLAAIVHSDTPWTRSSSPTQSRSTPAFAGTAAAATSNATANGYIDGSGPTIMGPSRSGITSTTTTRTEPITGRTIWFYAPSRRTSLGIALGHPMLLARHAAVTLATLWRGTAASLPTRGQRRRGRAGLTSSWSRSIARSAAHQSRPPSRPGPASAAVPARPQPAAVACGTADVYNLTVLGHPTYYANGILVHNCYDALRYLLGGLTGRTPKPARGFGEEQRAIRASSVG